MNIVRKLSSQRCPTVDESQITAAVDGGDRILALMHLRKLFADFSRSNLSASDYEQKLCRMVPLFNKLTLSFSADELKDQFKEAASLASHLSKLFVQEIRKRATNQNTGAAASFIITFLQPDGPPAECPKIGWQLLTALNFLIRTKSQNVVETVCQAALPSTLVKCLYLFYDLPQIDDACYPQTLSNRETLYEHVIELMSTLAGYSCTCDELVRRDDLALLFSGVSSWCPTHNQQWRRAASQLLMILSSRCMGQSAINYIHSKSCISLFVQNLRRGKDFGVVETAEMIVCLFCLLKDSSAKTKILFDDLKDSQGYQFLTEFILNNENDKKPEVQDALRNLLLMINTVVVCGSVELKPALLTSVLYTLPGFSIPQPVGPGYSVRNVNVFQVLESVFLKSQNSSICSTVLDVISNVYNSDPANYFILEPRCTLGQFGEIICAKSPEVQAKFFEIIEYVVFHLNYTPSKELLSVCISLKTSPIPTCATLCLHSFLKLLGYSALFKDVFREIGFIEVLVSWIQQYWTNLKQNNDIPVAQKTVYNVTFDMLAVLLKQSNQNAAVFRDSGGSRVIFALIRYEECKNACLTLVQFLLIAPGGDEELATLCTLLHSSGSDEMTLKIQILKCLVHVLRESHRVRLAFRRSGGNLYVVSLLVNMEGVFRVNAHSFVAPAADFLANLEQLQLIFKVLTLSMRFEPANAKFFASEVRFSSLSEGVRLLGCFRSDQLQLKTQCFCPENFQNTCKILNNEFDAIFDWKLEERKNFPSIVPQSLALACFLVRILYDMALDNFEKPVFIGRKPDVDSTSVDSRKSSNHQFIADHLIVHPGALICIAEILPSIFHDESEVMLSAQVFTAEILKSMVRSERNQQVMCEAGLPKTIFSVASQILVLDDHPLLAPFHYILERLASHSMQPKELRDFLRLGHPLCCRSLGIESEHIEKMDGGPVSLGRVKTLVSMMTPRDFRQSCTNLNSPFIEFDMSVEGFGCVYLPSIAPYGAAYDALPPNAPSVFFGAHPFWSPTGPENLPPISALSIHSPGQISNVGSSVAQSSVTSSGFSNGPFAGSFSSTPATNSTTDREQRIFPPLTGLTFSGWVYVDRYAEPTPADRHPLRLLTVVRSCAGVGPRPPAAYGKAASDSIERATELACLQLQISPIDHALLIATHETDTPGADLDRDVNSSDTFVRVSISELHQEQQWCHIAVVLARSMLKNSTAVVYINGKMHSSHKLHYITQISVAPLSSPNNQQAVTVKAIIGTAPGPFRKQSRLLWRLGSTFLIEDACSAQTIGQVYKLGASYVGNFQAPVLPSGEKLPPLLAEEKLIFGLNARSVSQTTLARLRKIFNKSDSKSIARTLGVSSHENATPIRLLHNSAAHLIGPVRSLGGVLIGYLGIRTFCPKPVAKLLESVGGSVPLLGMVAMAADTEGLYAAIKALLCAVRWNRNIAIEMDKCRGYQILAMLLKEKSHLLHSHVLHLIFSLIGTLDASHETASIPNVQAFEDLLCDLLAWRRTSPDLQRLLYEHFYLLITESGDQKNNLRIIRQIGLLGRILQITAADPRLLWTTKEIIFNLIAAILQPPCDNISLLRFGQFIASTLPTACAIDAEKKLPFDIRDLQTQLFSSECSIENVDQLILYQVYVRNRCLNILLNILLHTGGTLNQQICDQVAKVLGFDWIVALLSARSHSATVWAALKILLVLTGYPSLMQKFKEGVGNGGWLKEAESVVQNRAGVVLGFSVSARFGTVGSACDLNPEICNLPGFLALQHFLPHHVMAPDPYLALLSQLVGQPATDLPHVHQFDLDDIWTLIFGLPPNHSVSDAIGKVELCPEASLPLLGLIRRCISMFLTFLYHNILEFATYATSEEFLFALTATFFRDSHTSDSIDYTSRKSDGLPEHQAVKYVFDLLRNIIVDSFAFAPVTKGDTIIDTILELIPDGSGKQEQCSFVTCLLRSVMDHLVASDVLLCGQSLSLPLTLSVSSNYSVLAANVFYFTTRVVDCVWNGLYARDAQVVLDFVIKLFNQVKRKSGSSTLAEPLYFPLNRCTLFVLSRFVDGVHGQMSLLESLQKVIANRSIVFSTANSDPDFFCCLCHLLFMLTDISNQEVPLNVDCVDRNDPAATLEESRIRENAALIANTARRLWEELFLSKKAVVEETFNTPLVPEINAARALLGESANRCWRNFVDGETRGVVSKDAFQIHLQLQSKFQKVAGGLQRLASRKAARPVSVLKNMSVSAQTLELWMKVHISLIRELVELMYTQYVQWHEHTEKWCLDEWKCAEQELTRERGLWGPCHPSTLDKWQLDSTEGPCRMRKKFVPNPAFYMDYPYRPSLELSENVDVNPSMIRKASKQLTNPPLHLGRSDDDVDDQSMSIDDESSMTSSTARSKIDKSAQQLHEPSPTNQISRHDGEPDTSTNERRVDDKDDPPLLSSMPKISGSATGPAGAAQFHTPTGGPTLKGPDNQTLLRLLEEGEELQCMFRCARINGLETSEGLLLFGRERYYVVDGFTLLKTKEIRDLDFLPEDLHDPIIPYIANGPQRPNGVKRLCSKFPYEDIREVHKRRYLLQPIALEVFSADGRNYLLAFPKRSYHAMHAYKSRAMVRNKVYGKFVVAARGLVDAADRSVSGQRSSVNLEQGAGLLGTWMGETSVTQRWSRGEMSNFQYLMHLNTLAGRSYNDLSQYPVFPWVLADYDSEELDLNEPATFRDFSKSMGAQTPDRLEQFLKRYREWDDPSGETLPYMYGTHYSSAMIVVSYLVRMEPFTQQFLKLQGGHFDLADRMFHSIREAWFSASRNNMADVKELIPEFFYLPEFLVNSNKFDLGVKQSGVQLGDVQLPAWSKGSPREFVRLHREALECDFVSLHLHEWIDLIFGCKQQGQQAVDAKNLYHHLFYEGNVDFESIDDPLTRNATIGFINNFGQIPTQLFKKPHPQKKIRVFDSSLPTSGVTTERLFFNCLENLKPPMNTCKEVRGTVAQIAQNEKLQLCVVERNKILVPPNFSKFFSWGYADTSIRMGSLDAEKSSCIYELSDFGEIVCATCPNNRTIIMGGTNTVVGVWEIVNSPVKTSAVTLKHRKSLYGHTEAVTCLCASAAYGILVSGSRDFTCIVWDLSKLQFIRQLRPNLCPISAVCVNDATGDVAASCGTHLFLYSINGEQLATVNTAASPKFDGKQLILCIAFSTMNEWDPQHVIVTGSNDGVVRMWSLDFVQVPEQPSPAAPSSGDRPAVAPNAAATTVDERFRDGAVPPNTATDQSEGRLHRRSKTRSIGLSGSSSVAGDMVRMSDPLSSYDDTDFDLYTDPHADLPLTDPLTVNSADVDRLVDCRTPSTAVDRLDAEVLRERLAASKVDDADSPTTGPEVGPGPRFRIGDSQSEPESAGLDSGTGTPVAPGFSLKSGKSGLSNLSHTPDTPTFECRIARLANQGEEAGLFSPLYRQGSADSFVFVNKDGLAIVKTPNKLKKGFEWRRQLVFRYKLTMHTSFDRKDNVAPAAITSLAVSRDQKSIFVGDAAGRVWPWTISDGSVGGRADHWFQDPARSTCAQCHQKFSLTERRHHCRNCGQIFCAKCSRYESDIHHLKITKPVRVCQNCYIRLKVMDISNVRTVTP